MEFKKQTGKSIDEAFAEYDSATPIVYQLFKQQVERAIKAGKAKVSAKAIINWIRWEESFQNTSTGYKINDAFTSRYARKYLEEYPERRNYFELRQLRDITAPIVESYRTAS